MTTRTIDCIDCGASVPYGRLSCPACGALLASVTGGRPLVQPDPGIESEPELSTLLPDDDGDPAVPSPTPLEAPAPVLTGRPYRHLAPPPSAYRPSGLLSGAVVAGPGWAAPSVGAPGVAATVAAAPGSATKATHSRIGPLDPTRFAEIAGWFVVVGATMAVLGFLLPWARAVIGARSTGSYFDSWGLASPTHVVILAATMIVLALGIVRTSVPVWIRSGVAPLALGSLLIGLAWPYQVGPLGADVGVLVVVLGAVALVTGGVVGSWATRHVEVDPAV